jgi:hypothetical protein
MLFLAAYRMIAPTSLVLWILVNGKDYGLEYVQKKAGPFLTLPLISANYPITRW